MGRFSGLKTPMSFHKKQISIVSKIETTVEDDDRSDLEWRTKLEPVVSTTIRRGSETMVDDLPTTWNSASDPSVSTTRSSNEAMLILLDMASMETGTGVRVSRSSHQYIIHTQARLCTSQRRFVE
jgi:hypothetical protein